MAIVSYVSIYLFGSICIIGLMNTIFNLVSETNTRINEESESK